MTPTTQTSHLEKIRRALDFIDAHLREDICAQDVAAAASYSLSHFHAIFPRFTGSTLVEYIRRRRLAYAAYDLALSRRRILEIAVAYGFASQEAFTRAFVQEYAVTPGRFRKNRAYGEALSRLGVYRSQPLLGQPGAAQPPADGEAEAERLLLPDFPRVGFYRGGDQCPEDIPFPSCLAACLHYLGEPLDWYPLRSHDMTWRLNMTNVKLLGVTGMAFGLLWKDGWHTDCLDLTWIDDPRQIIRRAFAFAGYGYEIVQKSGAPDDAERFRQCVLAEIRAGRPVLGFGVVGPPSCSVITGFDRGGAVLTGWSFFQDHPAFCPQPELEPCGYFRQGDWFKDTVSLVLIGEKQTPGEGVVDWGETLTWILKVIQTPEVLGRRNGLAAYSAWAVHLGRDEDLTTGDLEVLRYRHDIHNRTVGVLAECRSWAAHFLRYLGERLPEQAEHFVRAGACYQSEHDRMWQLWDLLGGNGHPEAYLRFSDPAIRGEMVKIILEAQRVDRQAAGYLQRARDEIILNPSGGK